MWSLFRRAAPTANATTPKVPADRYVVLQGESEGKPEFRIVNQALDGLASARLFDWHLSIIIEMAEQNALGLPTKEEQAFLAALGEEMGKHLKADGNAALLASVTWDGARQLVFRVRDPERANAYLRTVVEDPAAPRPMDYRMESDPAWGLAEQYLAPGRGA